MLARASSAQGFSQQADQDAMLSIKALSAIVSGHPPAGASLIVQPWSDSLHRKQPA